MLVNVLNGENVALAGSGKTESVDSSCFVIVTSVTLHVFPNRLYRSKSICLLTAFQLRSSTFPVYVKDFKVGLQIQMFSLCFVVLYIPKVCDTETLRPVCLNINPACVLTPVCFVD